MNRAYRMFSEFASLVSTGDAARALAMTGDAFSWRMHDSGGLEFSRADLATLVEFVTTQDGSGVWETELLHARDDRWMMARLIAAQVESGFRSDWIIVGELDSSGLGARAVRFKGDDLRTAAELLDEWAKH